eukprot:491554-Pyramimonas_sp.AAC.1
MKTPSLYCEIWSWSTRSGGLPGATRSTRACVHAATNVRAEIESNSTRTHVEPEPRRSRTTYIRTRGPARPR